MQQQQLSPRADKTHSSSSATFASWDEKFCSPSIITCSSSKTFFAYFPCLITSPSGHPQESRVHMNPTKFYFILKSCWIEMPLIFNPVTTLINENEQKPDSGIFRSALLGDPCAAERLIFVNTFGGHLKAAGRDLSPLQTQKSGRVLTQVKMFTPLSPMTNVSIIV